MQSWFFRGCCFLALLVGSGCDGILDLQPAQAIDSDNLIVDASSAATAMNGLYSRAQDFFGSRMIISMAVASDNTDHLGTFQAWRALDALDPLADQFPATETWASAYALIYNANLLLDRLPEVDDPRLAREQLSGEARTLRAWAYFYLANVFGDVPLIVAPLRSLNDISSPKTSEAEVLEFVVRELERAESEVQTNADPQRITVATVHAMRAKVYLRLADWTAALRAADAVIADRFVLEPNYLDLFDGIPSDEVIWELPFDAVDANNLAFNYWEPPLGRHEIGPNPDVVALFEADDARAGAVAAATNTINGELYVAKYRDPGAGTDNPILLRLADMLLIRAEALGESGRFQEATVAFNRVRERSIPGGGLTLTAANFKELILRERLLELSWEAGNRWLDLQRTQLGPDFTQTKEQQACRLKWPVPRVEVDANGALNQNPCY